MENNAKEQNDLFNGKNARDDMSSYAHYPNHFDCFIANNIFCFRFTFFVLFINLLSIFPDSLFFLIISSDAVDLLVYLRFVSQYFKAGNLFREFIILGTFPQYTKCCKRLTESKETKLDANLKLIKTRLMLKSAKKNNS